MMCLGGGENYDDGKNHDNDLEVRDYFAGKVINGMMANGSWFMGKTWKTEKEMFKAYAKEAYKFADEMMKERDR